MRAIGLIILFTLATALSGAKRRDFSDHISIILNHKWVSDWAESSEPVNVKLYLRNTDTLAFSARTDWGGLLNSSIKITDPQGNVLKTILSNYNYDPSFADFYTSMLFLDSIKGNQFQVYINMQGYNKTYEDKYIFSVNFTSKKNTSPYICR